MRISNFVKRVSNFVKRVSNFVMRVSNFVKQVSNDVLEKHHKNKQKNRYINHISINTAQFRSTMVQIFYYV